jgi:hypothetical protein
MSAIHPYISILIRGLFNAEHRRRPDIGVKLEGLPRRMGERWVLAVNFIAERRREARSF